MYKRYIGTYNTKCTYLCMYSKLFPCEILCIYTIYYLYLDWTQEDTWSSISNLGYVESFSWTTQEGTYIAT